MLRVRTTTLPSGHISVQVVHRHHHKTDIVKHIGTARNTKQKLQLIDLAYQYISTNVHTPPLLPEAFVTSPDPSLASLDNVRFTAWHHTFAYEFLSFFYNHNGFDRLNCPALRDLSIMRIIEPCSKLRTVKLLKEYFAISYPVNYIYDQLLEIRRLKERIETVAVSYATHHLKFDFSLVFYDVTTLYFETNTADCDTQDTIGNTVTGLRMHGFSKDNKPQQPQVVIGLVVNNDGYPIAVHTFSGKTFEGHTIIPVIKKLQQQHNIRKLTIVADAAMLSIDNIKDIEEEKLHYIVGARLGNISLMLLSDISRKLNKTEGTYYKTNTPRGILICDYSNKRAAKDKSDRKRQLKKAQHQLRHPHTAKRKARFVQEETTAILTLNKHLIVKDELREGIKGYYTNLETTSPDIIIKHYKDLWHVEQSFRIAKSDLSARPIFHHKRERIEAHIIIVFVSLCLTKSIELITNYSIKKVKDMIWNILDIKLTDICTGRTYTKRMEAAGNAMAELLNKLRQQNPRQPKKNNPLS